MTETEMAKALDGLRLHVIPRCADPIVAMRSTLRALDAAGAKGTRMVIWDYVQLMADISKDVRTGTIAAVRAIKDINLTEDVVTVVLSQTSRGNAKAIREGTDSAEKLVGTGAETAELENAATWSLVLSYQSKDDAEIHDVTVLITKGRFGGGSQLGFKFNGRTGTWTETGGPALSRAEQRREDAILEALRTHAESTCHGPGIRCMGRMTLNTLKSGYGAPGAKIHLVGGDKEDLSRTLHRLKLEGKIDKVGEEWGIK
jgi:hypothetical protein